MVCPSYCIVTAVCLVTCLPVCFSQQHDKLSVLFIISAYLTTTAISAYGNTACQTPNIDLLASEGVKYTHAYSQYPICRPSRASLMFGYYPTATGTYGYVSGREKDRQSGV